MGYLAEPFVSICGELHAREGVSASSTPMGSCLVIGRGANSLEARSSAQISILIAFITGNSSLEPLIEGLCETGATATAHQPGFSR